MKRRIKTMFDDIPNCNGVPPGRLGDVLERLTDDAKRRTALQEVGYGLDSGYVLWLFSTRTEAEAFVRKREEEPNCKWKMLIR